MGVRCASLFTLFLTLGFQGMDCKAQSVKEVAARIDRACDRIRADIADQEGIVKDLPDARSAEGGEGTAYMGPSGICYLRVIWYGETGRNEVDYYFEQDSLIFAQDRHVEYNRPIYWDRENAAANGDTVVFDPGLSRVEENRYYFQHHRLVLWLDPALAPVDLTMGTNTITGQGLISHAFSALGAFK